MSIVYRNRNTSSQKELKKTQNFLCKTIVLPKPSVSPIRLSVVKALRSQSISRPITSPNSIKIKELKLDFAKSPSPKSLPHAALSKLRVKGNKVFIIQGDYPDLKRALIDRGWVENPDNLSLNFNLLWARTAKFPSKLQDWQLINHFPKNYELSAKWNFCENIKKTRKITNYDPYTFFPRCYRLFGKEIEEFSDVFKAEKAAGIVKTYVQANGGYCYEKIATAICVVNRSVHFLERNIKIDRDRSLSLIHPSEWKIINSNNSHEINAEFYRFYMGKSQAQASAIKDMAREAAARLEASDPQYHMGGNRNIWIVKPGRKSRGRDIMLFANLDEIKTYTQNSQQWVVQKYIENPLLINRKKFDIRQWVLVSNIDPLTIWIYKESYLRFSVENYEVGNLENPYIHLTNNSISKHSNKFKSSEIAGCMWHIDQFTEYLDSKYSKNYWTDTIFPRIKEIVKCSILSVGDLGRKNCFELFGYDFMIDSRLNPWLLEVNSSPALDYSTVIYI